VCTWSGAARGTQQWRASDARLSLLPALQHGAMMPPRYGGPPPAKRRNMMMPPAITMPGDADAAAPAQVRARQQLQAEPCRAGKPLVAAMPCCCRTHAHASWHGTRGGCFARS
jgi:hypothetical protein